MSVASTARKPVVGPGNCTSAGYGGHVAAAKPVAGAGAGIGPSPNDSA